MLDLADVMTLAQTCAPAVAPETLSAIAWTESRFDPLAIGVNRGARPTARAATPKAAARTARALIARGGDVDLGLAQINSANLAWLGLSVEAAFDPCRNLAAAAQVLAAGYRPAGASARHHQVALRIALSRYNTGHPERGFRNGYVSRVERAALRLHGRAAFHRPAEPRDPPLTEPAAPPAAWDVFGRASLSAVFVFRSIEPRSPTP